MWFAFARHEKVVDAFIDNSLSRGGKKYGFVRFGNRSDALRAVGRLNGFWLYGFRLKVAFATFKRKARHEATIQRENTDGGNEKIDSETMDKSKGAAREEGESSEKEISSIRKRRSYGT
ncbi:hypothetical protein V6N13_100334 [Hibiscus sabdariffa]